MDRVYHIILCTSIFDMNLTLRVANYMSRYAPSRTKIVGYLTKKKCQDVSTFLMEIGYDESMMIQMWMRTYITLGKGRREIEMKLMKKGFQKEMIREYIEQNIGEIEDWESQKQNILRQIDMLIGRGKSTRMIASLLEQKYPYFREEIRCALVATDDADALEKEMQKYKNRYNTNDPKDREKVIAALMRKGFSYREIKGKVEVGGRR